ncbi:Uncharacterised protein [Mycobacteroides abscessus subsp. abscessus]|nr:Uncharacterised protein [Mycobacteroides abscessus subsp. abscessus]
MASGASSAEASSSLSCWAASRLALRLSCTRETWMENSNSNVSASPSAVMENGSEPGVANAAKTKRPKIKPRRQFLSLS